MRNVNVYPINKIPELYFLGRDVSCAEKKSFRTLFWNGSGFEVHFKGRELWALIEGGFETLEPWLVVFLNGRINSRQMITKGKQWICLARGFDDSYETDIRVMKDSQPMADDPEHFIKIHKLALTKGGSFSKLPEHKMKIEFVGDSITTGEGLAGAVDDMAWIGCHMSFCKTYAYQTAEKLDADFRVVSQGGFGIVSAWNNNPYYVIPPEYENVCSIPKGKLYEKLGGYQKYDFSKWKSDFVIINLGTNDRGGFYFEPWTDPDTGKVYKMNLDENGKPCASDGAKITEGTKKFLYVVRKNNPAAKIIWATGMMYIPEVMGFIYEGISQFKNETGDKNVFTLEFDSMDCETNEEDKGSRQHPGPKTHRLAAEKLSMVIKSLYSTEKV
ncbi:SGNH/GDSL hydrolase family protein [Treponema sp.]|uniref:SGNH/GDSL hydrolase family protein n=1 Tax=Treponema sp. TaxID=166 RepID=UPI00298DFB45|nr:SGNH/GDSL hydrolase family protein [Treponema sp.]